MFKQKPLAMPMLTTAKNRNQSFLRKRKFSSIQRTLTYISAHEVPKIVDKKPWQW